MARDIGRGPITWCALILLRHDVRLRAIVAALIPCATFLAGRYSVDLPAQVNPLLLLGALVAIPVLYLYHLPQANLAALVARVLLRKDNGGLVAVARSRNDAELPTYLSKHYPQWLAPGIVEAVREQARNKKEQGPIRL